MKYDRPVWKIMHECADAMPETFRYEDVRDWFLSNYPDVNEATIRAHLIGLTEGGRAKHVQFAHRAPVFRRVTRGQYEPIAKDQRGEDPDGPQASSSRLKMFGKAVTRPAEEAPGKGSEPVRDDAESVTSSADTIAEPDNPLGMCSEREPHVFDVILLGSLGDRVSVPAPAKEVFREFEFQLSRADAEKTGNQWFVLSAEHGLVAPNEWITPDVRTLADMMPEYRVAWATWVVARLESLVGSLDGLSIRVDAPDAFIGPLFADLQESGAVVSSGNLELPVVRRHESAQAHHDIAEVTPIRPAVAIARHLADPENQLQLSELDMAPESAGLYGWCVDPIGARTLNRCLRLPIRPGVLFVGQAGASGLSIGVEPVRSLRDQIETVQLRGRARASTFRMALATILQQHLQMKSLDDPRLTEWMTEHLSVTVWPSDDVTELRDLAQFVIAEINPPLNVDDLPVADYRLRLSQMRSALA
ncbi:DUF7669 domain-containing protein [Aeromicrobium sp. P5_D10]